MFYIVLDPERAPSRPYREPWEPQSTRQGSTSAATGSKWRTREAEISVPAKYLPRKQTTSTQHQQPTNQPSWSGVVCCVVWSITSFRIWDSSSTWIWPLLGARELLEVRNQLFAGCYSDLNSELQAYLLVFIYTNFFFFNLLQ